MTFADLTEELSCNLLIPKWEMGFFVVVVTEIQFIYIIILVQMNNITI